MREVAQLAATDVNLFNQDACVSSRYQYVEATTEQADRYCELLVDELAKDRFCGPGTGPGPDRALRDNIDGLRFLEPEVRVFGDYSGRGTVIRSEEPIEFYPDRKTVNVVPVKSIVDAIQFANVATQTVGVYPHERSAEVRDGLMLAGAQRMVPLGHAIGGPRMPHDAFYTLHRMVRWVVDEAPPIQEPGYLRPLVSESRPEPAALEN
jgi:Acyl-CoA reductase (LuxC)